MTLKRARLMTQAVEHGTQTDLEKFFGDCLRAHAADVRGDMANDMMGRND